MDLLKENFRRRNVVAFDRKSNLKSLELLSAGPEGKMEIQESVILKHTEQVLEYLRKMKAKRQ
jgi:hypothetical protein